MKEGRIRGIRERVKKEVEIKERKRRHETLLTSMEQFPKIVHLLLGWEMATVIEILKELTSF
jgi:hypothetical protein